MVWGAAVTIAWPRRAETVEVPDTIPRPAAENANKFVPIGTITLLPSAGFAFDLYTRRTRANSCELFLKAGLPLDGQTLLQLIDQTRLALYIRYEEQGRYEAYLAELLANATKLSPAQRYALMRAAAMNVFTEAYSTGCVSDIVRAVEGIAEGLVECLGGDVTLSEIFGMMARDYTTYAHANNVSTYCVALAKNLGIHSRADLLDIAAGGLLHDIGKRRLPPALLKKADLLSDKERQLIRRHAQWGFEDLAGNENLQAGTLMMVFQHHERINGTGYPVQISGEEIHPWSNICAVAEVFDSLTSRQTYRPARSKSDALDVIERNSGTWFQPEVVSCLTKLIPRI